MIPWAKPNYHCNEEKYVRQALKSTWISDGSFIKNFEKRFCSYVNSIFAISGLFFDKTFFSVESLLLQEINNSSI